MALFSKEYRYLMAGLGIGYGAGLATPHLLPVVPGMARPLAKATLKAGLVGIERGRELLAHLREELEDVVAEVREELAEHAEAEPSEPEEISSPAMASEGRA